MQKETHRATVFKKCRNTAKMRVGGRHNAQTLKRQLDAILKGAELTLFGPALRRYSQNNDDGYTYLAPIGLSGVMIHTYPEKGTVTLSLVTCSGEGAQDSARRLRSGLKRFFGASKVTSHKPRYLPLD